MPGLLAVGVCSGTGLHGANRLAANSLSECFVFGSRAARAALDAPPGEQPPPAPEWRFDPPRIETRDAVWRYAGPRRDAAGLERLLDDPYPLARLIAGAALARRESRGVHRRRDFPLPDRALDGGHLVVDPSGATDLVRWA